MKILNLIIKGEYFDKIIKGEKKQEFREIRPTTTSKYCEVDNDGSVILKDGIIIPRKYDAIQFFVGYNKDRECALVEVKSAEIELFVDDDGNFIEYEYKGEIHLAAQVVYNLGNIIKH